MTKDPSSDNENLDAENGGGSSVPRYGERSHDSKPWDAEREGQAEGTSSFGQQQYGQSGAYQSDQPRYGHNDSSQQSYQAGTYGSYGDSSAQDGSYGGYGSTSPQNGQQHDGGAPQYAQPGAYGTGADSYGNQSNANGTPGYYGGSPRPYDSYQGQQAQYSGNGYGQPQYQQQYPTSQPQRPNGWGMGLAAMICGIGSLVLCWLVFPALAGIVAIILGIVAIKKLGKTPGAGKAMPIVGIILGAIGAIVSVIFLIFWIFSFSIANEAAQNCGGYGNANSSSYQQCIDDYIANQAGN
ncbi:DUF4190 domain-containing protein [Kocuria massiliensis]|uniref:DUF4190 domain-containing protein n=1 Tax=Kocuria massiliensis TaxID=1926282 RepID=UPI000A1C7B62|nr:DUF4190 domain-containing protein [Kocuria massiliensis]MCT1367557.1 DUF4190 domain-containing protein [Rothia sp. p3-SID1597]